MEKIEISAGISVSSVVKCIDDYGGFLRKIRNIAAQSAVRENERIHLHTYINNM